MLTLHQALQKLPWHLIAVIGRQHNLGFDSNLKKNEVIGRVHGRLLDQTYLTGLWAQLPVDGQDLLTDVLSSGGSLPAPQLSLRYGQRRAHRALLAAYREGLPLSPVEKLCLLGLLFFDQNGNRLFIPVDLQALLPQPQTLPLPLASISGEAEAPVDLLVHDLALLLGLLQREYTRPHHGRWLPPNLLKSWGSACRVAPLSPVARSELQTGRRRFIHYLAESAGFVASPPAAVLTPTPAAWLWLKAAPADRWRRLWEVWSRPEPALWRQYRLPGAAWLTDPAALLGPLHQALPLLEPAEPRLFVETLLRRRPDLPLLLPATIPERLELMGEIVIQLLTGPLTWLGILQKEEAGITSSDSSSILQLSSHGLATLTGRPLPAPAPAAKFALTADIQPDPLKSTLILTPNPGLPDPADLVVAIELKDELGRMKDKSEGGPKDSSFILRPSSFIRALHRGWAPVALVEALKGLVDRPLSGEALALLQSWAGAAGRMVIHQAAVLETNQPEIITRLASTRRGRALIHRTLSPRAVIIDPAQLDLLIRRLTEQEGTPPLVQGSRQENGGVRKHVQAAAAQRSKGENSSLHSHPPAPIRPYSSASHLWLALKVYQALGQYLPLPARIPQAVLDQVRAGAGEEALAAAEIAAGQTVAALQRVLDGYTAFPPWPEGNLPVEESLPVIEQALATGQNLALLYYAAGTNRLTRRIVEPYRIEWHGRRAGERGSRPRPEPVERGVEETESPKSGTPYLIGFCQEDQGERMFRLDRVREIALHSRQDSSEF